MRAATPKPFSPDLQLCKKCRERCFWAKVAPTGALVLLERDPAPLGAYTVLRMEKRTPIVAVVYSSAAPEGSEKGTLYGAHPGRCPGPR